MPLKYINIWENKIEESFILYYSFPLVKTILNDYNNFRKRKKFYKSEDNELQKENNFLAILKIKLRIYNLSIDGYLEVGELIKMNLINIYAKINSNYFLNKKIIFINQVDNIGELYDFALFIVKEKNLILFKATYCSSHN